MMWPLTAVISCFLGPIFRWTAQQPTSRYASIQQKTFTLGLSRGNSTSKSRQPATFIHRRSLNTAGAKAMFGSCGEGAVPSDETTGSRNARVGETAYVKTRRGETDWVDRTRKAGHAGKWGNAQEREKEACFYRNNWFYKCQQYKGIRGNGVTQLCNALNISH